jgi:hypothetical protein
MTADHKSKANIAKASGSKQQTQLSAHVVQAKLGRFCAEIAAALVAMFVSILMARVAKVEGDFYALLFTRTVLIVALYFFVSQLSAIIRLVKFGGACVMDRKGFKHFSMGGLAWSAIRSAELIEVERNEKAYFTKNFQTFLVLNLDRRTLDAIRPNWINRLILRRYARFVVESSTIELSCDFLKIEPNNLLWHVLQRTDPGSKQYAS